MSAQPLAQTLDSNRHGRDFVVGDIHGCFEQLEALLLEVDFQPRRDRLFSLGDLIDRGPHSLRALEFLAQPWFFAVRGNHEDMMLRALDGDSRQFDLWQQVGGRWAQFADTQALDRLRQACATLPYALEVTTSRGRVGIVHADWPAVDWPRLFQRLQQRRADTRSRQALLWSRQRWRRLELDRLNPGLSGANRVAGIDLICIGHNPVAHATRLGDFLFLDTGAGHGGQLSLLELDSGEILQQTTPAAEF